MESKLPAFKESNPQLEVETKHIGGQHPHLEGIYSKSSFIYSWEKMGIVYLTVNKSCSRTKYCLF